MRCSSNPPFFFFFFDTWQIINGGLGRLETEQRAKTHRQRCLTAQVRADKNLLLAVFFMRLVHQSSEDVDLAFEQSFLQRSWLSLSNKMKKVI